MSAKAQKPTILTDQYWLPPSPSKQGSESIWKVYEAVGFATTYWEFVENDLAELFCTFTSRKSPVRRAYGTIFGNSGRREAVQAAGEAYFGKYWNSGPVSASVTSLVHAIGQAARRRDQIVHGAVTHFHSVQKPGAQIDHGAFLMPPEYNARYTNLVHDWSYDLGFPSKARYRYTAKDITAIGNKFDALSKFISEYRNQVTTKPDGSIPFIESLIEAGRIKRE